MSDITKRVSIKSIYLSLFMLGLSSMLINSMMDLESFIFLRLLGSSIYDAQGMCFFLRRFNLMVGIVMTFLSITFCGPVVCGYWHWLLFFGYLIMSVYISLLSSSAATISKSTVAGVFALSIISYALQTSSVKFMFDPKIFDGDEDCSLHILIFLAGCFSSGILVRMLLKFSKTNPFLTLNDSRAALHLFNRLFWVFTFISGISALLLSRMTCVKDDEEDEEATSGQSLSELLNNNNRWIFVAACLGWCFSPMLNNFAISLVHNLDRLQSIDLEYVQYFTSLVVSLIICTLVYNEIIVFKGKTVTYSSFYTALCGIVKLEGVENTLSDDGVSEEATSMASSINSRLVRSIQPWVALPHGYWTEWEEYDNSDNHRMVTLVSMHMTISKIRNEDIYDVYDPCEDPKSLSDYYMDLLDCRYSLLWLICCFVSYYQNLLATIGEIFPDESCGGTNCCCLTELCTKIKSHKCCCISEESKPKIECNKCQACDCKNNKYLKCYVTSTINTCIKDANKLILDINSCNELGDDFEVTSETILLSATALERFLLTFLCLLVYARLVDEFLLLHSLMKSIAVNICKSFSNYCEKCKCEKDSKPEAKDCKCCCTLYFKLLKCLCMLHEKHNDVVNIILGKSAANLASTIPTLSLIRSVSLLSTYFSDFLDSKFVCEPSTCGCKCQKDNCSCKKYSTKLDDILNLMIGGLEFFSECDGLLSSVIYLISNFAKENFTCISLRPSTLYMHDWTFPKISYDKICDVTKLDSCFSNLSECCPSSSGKCLCHNGNAKKEYYCCQCCSENCVCGGVPTSNKSCCSENCKCNCCTKNVMICCKCIERDKIISCCATYSTAKHRCNTCLDCSCHSLEGFGICINGNKQEECEKHSCGKFNCLIGGSECSLICCVSLTISRIGSSSIFSMCREVFRFGSHLRKISSNSCTHGKACVCKCCEDIKCCIDCNVFSCLKTICSETKDTIECVKACKDGNCSCLPCLLGCTVSHIKKFKACFTQGKSCMICPQVVDDWSSRNCTISSSISSSCYIKTISSCTCQNCCCKNESAGCTTTECKCPCAKIKPSDFESLSKRINTYDKCTRNRLYNVRAYGFCKISQIERNIKEINEETEKCKKNVVCDITKLTGRMELVAGQSKIFKSMLSTITRTLHRSSLEFNKLCKYLDCLMEKTGRSMQLVYSTRKSMMTQSMKDVVKEYKQEIKPKEMIEEKFIDGNFILLYLSLCFMILLFCKIGGIIPYVRNIPYVPKLRFLVMAFATVTSFTLNYSLASLSTSRCNRDYLINMAMLLGLVSGIIYSWVSQWLTYRMFLYEQFRLIYARFRLIYPSSVYRYQPGWFWWFEGFVSFLKMDFYAMVVMLTFGNLKESYDPFSFGFSSRFEANYDLVDSGSHIFSEEDCLKHIKKSVLEASPMKLSTMLDLRSFLSIPRNNCNFLTDVDDGESVNYSVDLLWQSWKTGVKATSFADRLQHLRENALKLAEKAVQKSARDSSYDFDSVNQLKVMFEFQNEHLLDLPSKCLTDAAGNSQILLSVQARKLLKLYEKEYLRLWHSYYSDHSEGEKVEKYALPGDIMSMAELLSEFKQWEKNKYEMCDEVFGSHDICKSVVSRVVEEFNSILADNTPFAIIENYKGIISDSYVVEEMPSEIKIAKFLTEASKSSDIQQLNLIKSEMASLMQNNDPNLKKYIGTLLNGYVSLCKNIDAESSMSEKFWKHDGYLLGEWMRWQGLPTSNDVIDMFFKLYSF
ncbi:hypothetical protein BEWA_020130 [Theileria equi strain WA]|uniref:Uncharacterized protein n=1 Tax=Theileria equi strain WA TaxID=1537102 RepID=L0AU45_THEEQ|nr:hypothetical protein BEWA_020130 [Theileria equi strain WA]AFZ79167.1 hypothetical protein BEWA_020130 [Theileria equi strain WA]|eukprot:XP_004828833.1 hypothetical protein BEWA_020130 [Theileria equi strain WA]